MDDVSSILEHVEAAASPEFYTIESLGGARFLSRWTFARLRDGGTTLPEAAIRSRDDR